MSELKVHHFVSIDELHQDDLYTCSGLPYYLKADADKVIAGLQDKLQKESALLKETREWLIESQKMHKRCADNASRMIRHSNRKRCLVMAEMCKARYDEEDARVNGHYSSWEYISQEMKYWERWQRCWLELAEEPT